MDDKTESISEILQRLRQHDSTLTMIFIPNQQLTDSKMAELADCLVLHPDVITSVKLSGNQLTDETGVKLARYVAISSTIEWLDLSSNQFGKATYLALAAALRINTSLQELYLDNNPAVDRTCVEAAFIETLRLNPHRPVESDWQLYAAHWVDVDFKRLKSMADELSHPTLQMILNHGLEKKEIESVKRIL